MNDQSSLMPVVETLDALQRWQNGVSPERLAKSLSPEARDLMGISRPPAPRTKHVASRGRQSDAARRQHQKDDLAKRKADRTTREMERDRSEARMAKAMTDLSELSAKLAKARGPQAPRYREDRQKAARTYRGLRDDLAKMPGKVPADLVNAIENRLNSIGGKLAALGLI